MAFLTCDNISFSYENQTVVSNLSFSIEKGDYLCIVGENGTGKTTLMKGLLGLKRPSGGQITRGEDFHAGGIGYVPQQTLAQRDFPASVYEVVLSGCLGSTGLRPLFSSKEKAKADKNLQILGIRNLRKKCYRNLSGGQQQRVLLARSLCAAESMLLLDEPANGLDPVATAEFYQLLDDLNTEHGITIVMVSHAIKEAIENAKKILHLSHQHYFFGTVEEYRSSEQGGIFMRGRRE